MVFTLWSSKCPPFLVLLLVFACYKLKKKYFAHSLCLLKNPAVAGFLATFDGNVYISVNELRPVTRNIKIKRGEKRQIFSLFFFTLEF